jgi:peptide methionine sulfoxide reductase msrA/msrB
MNTRTETALFAGGCFWCMVQPFEEIPGVIEVISGYAGGIGEHPTYQDFKYNGFVEAVRIVYDPTLVSYTQLLDMYWKQIDPTDQAGQFYDRGEHYRPIIFYYNQEQKKLAEQSKIALITSKRFSAPITTEVIEYTNFYPAEQYHQQFYKKNPDYYQKYKSASGRAEFIKKHWKSQTQEELCKKLTPLQYDVMICDATEPAFDNEYWNNKSAGIYVDRISGEPLFSSLDKYDSGTGWPSFKQPIKPENITEKTDTKLARPRTEIRSTTSDAHLGHVFSDGPQPTGLRYCINSAALRFIPLENLEREGYGAYKQLFSK